MVKDKMLKRLLDKLKDEYGNLDDACGCTVLCNNGEYKWLSLAIIKNMIEEVDREYDAE